jgi:hypothetical protein
MRAGGVAFVRLLNTVMDEPSALTRGNSEGPVPVDCRKGTLGVPVLTVMICLMDEIKGRDSKTCQCP